MIWHLIAAIFAGLGAAGIGMLLRLLSGKRLPRWIIPAFAGLGMLGYQIHYEYAWFDHKLQQLPATAHVVEVEQDAMFWRPWTYLHPMTTGFSVVDEQSMSVREEDGERRVEFLLYRFEKQLQDRVSHQTWLMNCASREVLPLEGEGREPRLDEMRRLGDQAPLYRAICREA
ncbi:hypothetical protein [Halomonas urumqiensis]|uniref:Uncharacterized protein n=1 Tax=Halomonas urumqiensis TaxID=1684789 RepID=A0A2N7UGT8_9GAMM|nr:hypothetical protein [Halomonas urumqiensis]PMR79676.1 hypothetical protein C1H70_11280 [Halomonas urumqiensis]PTB03095.1 hypothetical protein C6V82_00795 [Halomonas urumqiensis]GHE20769.1 hypothetical protein GCM10017767_12900 [Halomonas urumqiensis]